MARSIFHWNPIESNPEILKKKQLVNEIHRIIDLVQQNESIAAKFYEVETQILSILNFKDLFEVLLAGIKEKFRVPYVWMTLIDSSEVSNLIRSLESSEALKECLSRIDKNSFFELIGISKKPVLVNEDLKPYLKLLPQHKRYFIKSIAITPISFDGDIIGSLNQADFASERFQPGMDTCLLEQLAVKVSLCLSNVTAHEKLKYLAFHDPLTGLLNRRVMEMQLKRELSRAKRYMAPLSVAFLDLDDFKYVNDTYGHDQGDSLLVYVAEKLVQLSRESDIISRFAGDEFVIILPETGLENATNLLKRLRQYFLDNPTSVGDTRVAVSMSYGIASTEDDDVTSEAVLLKKADQRLYEAKAIRETVRSRC